MREGRVISESIHVVLNHLFWRNPENLARKTAVISHLSPSEAIPQSPSLIPISIPLTFLISLYLTSLSLKHFLYSREIRSLPSWLTLRTHSANSLGKLGVCGVSDSFFLVCCALDSSSFISSLERSRYCVIHLRVYSLNPIDFSLSRVSPRSHSLQNSVCRRNSFSFPWTKSDNSIISLLSLPQSTTTGKVED